MYVCLCLCLYLCCLLCVCALACVCIHMAIRQLNNQLPGYTGGASGTPAKALYGPINYDSIGFNRGTRPHQANPLFAWDSASSALVWCLGTSTSSGTHNKCYRFRIGVDSAPQAWGRLGIGMYAKVNSGTRCVDGLSKQHGVCLRLLCDYRSRVIVCRVPIL